MTTIELRRPKTVERRQLDDPRERRAAREEAERQARAARQALKARKK